MRVRLNAFLARAGVASRRKADELIKAGRVLVNGEPGQLNTFVGSRDRVEVDGREVAAQRLAYVLLHKPAGVVTTASDPQGRPTVVELVQHEVRVVPVGRLDADTTGALLLTNDGALAHRLAHPKYEVEKVYEAEVEGEPSDEAVRRLGGGRRAGGRPDRTGRGSPTRALDDRAIDPRGPQPAGPPDAGGSRAPGPAAAPKPLCGPNAGRPGLRASGASSLSRRSSRSFATD